MKDQYFGDIGDYGKYLLLRHLSSYGIKLGINWYLTKDDSTGHGSMTDYLECIDSSLRLLDPELFDALREIVITKRQRDVIASESMNLLEQVTYYNDILDISHLKTPEEKRIFRVEWHKRALKELSGADLIYFDPDNGIYENDKNEVSGRKNSVKYLLTSEAADYYKAGHNLVYYCHKGRRKQTAWDDYKKVLLNGKESETFADAEIICLTFHRGVQRSFIFAIHPEDYERYRTIIDSFMTSFCREHFSEEEVMPRYYLILDRILGKVEDPPYGLCYIYSNAEWIDDEECMIRDRLIGYDPYEDPGHGIGNIDIMNEIEQISRAEAERIINKESGIRNQNEKQVSPR